MEQDSPFPAIRPIAATGWMQPTSLLTCMTEINLVSGRNRPAHIFRIQQAMAVHRQACDGVPLLLQAVSCMQDGMMLYGRSDEMGVFWGIPVQSSKESKIIRFGRSTGKDDFIRQTTDAMGNLLPSLSEKLACAPAQCMLDGFPKSTSMAVSICLLTMGWTGVVAQ